MLGMMQDPEYGLEEEENGPHFLMVVILELVIEVGELAVGVEN